MRALFLSLVVLASLVVAGTVLAPRLIDGRAIEQHVAAEIEKATGRQVAIRGAIDAHLFPRPGLSIARVVIGNPVAAHEPVVVEIDRVDLDISIMPLLRGEIDIGRARLVRPIAKLGAPPSLALLADLLPAIQRSDLAIHRLEVVDGRAQVSEGDGITSPALEQANAEMDIDPISAAVELKGSARLQDTLLQLQLDTGLPVASASIPLKLKLDAGGGGSIASLAFTGIARLDPAAPTVEGAMELSAPNTSLLLSRLSTLRPLPDALSLLPSGKGLLRGSLIWSPASLKLSEATLDLEGAELTGSLAVEQSPSSAHLTVQIASNQVDLGDTPLTRWRDLITLIEPPPGLAGSIQLAIGAISWRGQDIRQARLDARLPGDGGIEIGRLAASLPGNGSLDVQGTISPSHTGPTWQGQVTAATDDLSGALAWLGIPAGRLPPGRLQSFSVSANTTATPTTLGVTDADVHLDASHVTGAGKLIRGARPTIAVKASVDRLNLDAYVADPAALVRRALDENLLGRIDAAVDLTIERLGWQDLRAGRVALDAELDRGTIKLDKLVIDDVAGAHGRLVGSLRPITDSFDLAGELEVPSVLRLARLFGIELPPPLVALGTVRGSGTARSDHGRGDVEVSIDSQLLALTAEGTLGRSAGPDTLDLSLQVHAPSASAMVRQLGASGFVEPSLGGPLDGRLRIRRRPDAPYRLDIALGLGDTRIAGPLTVALDGPAPSVAGQLDLSRVDVQTLLDTYRFLEPALDLVPGPLRSWPGDWPTQPFDWKALGLVRLDIALHVTPTSGGAELGSGALHLTTGDDRLVIEGIDVPLAGGRLTGRIAADDVATAPHLSIDLALDNSDAASLMTALRASPGLRGRLSLDLKGTTVGLSLGDLVGNLNGSLGLRLEGATLDGVDLTTSGPSVMGLNAQTVINELSGGLRLVHGIAATDEPGLPMALANGNGLLDGHFDLLAWVLNAKTTVTPLAQPQGTAVTHKLLGPPDRLVLLDERPELNDPSGEADQQP